jgi:hypothetical protein
MLIAPRKSGTIGRNKPEVHSVLAVLLYFKGTSSRTGKPIPPGVFYSLALTFGTLLSSQGTEASFETVSPAPPGFPFVVSNLTRSVSRFRSSFPAPCWSGVFVSRLPACPLL